MKRSAVLAVRPVRRAAGRTDPAGIETSAPLARGADTTLAEQLARRFAERIRQRLLAPGARLPSVRECARHHAVSPYTVVAAYDQLQAQGLVEARHQRGFFVRADEGRANAGARPLAASAPMRPLPNSATALIRGMFQSPGGRPMPGLGTLPAEWLDAPMLAAAMRRATSSAQIEAVALQYGDPAGELRLREALALKIADFGIVATPAQIATTVGATQALDIVTRTLLRAGDSVLVDEPGWSVEYARLAALGMHVLPVPRGENGADVAAMRRLIEAQKAAARPRLYITVSVLHNPTGATLSLQTAHRVLQLATEFGLHIVEDDTYAHLAPAHAPRLAALDALERTIYVSGFSKILTPNWRIGFLAAPAALVDRLVDTKLLTTLTTPSSGELAMAHCLEQGWLRRHAERVRERLAAARERTTRLAEAHGCRFAAPARGLFGWVDAGVDTERLAQALLDDWLIAPGSLFHAEPRPTTLMRINFATSQDARFWKALAAARARL
jgi:DNA-binding transcriptional MocR family regulator